MIYQAYEAFEMMAAPVWRFAEEAVDHFSQPWSGMHGRNWPPSWPAAASVLAQARLTHTRPEFGIAQIAVGNRVVEVQEEIAGRDAVRPAATLRQVYRCCTATRADCG